MAGNVHTQKSVDNIGSELPNASINYGRIFIGIDGKIRVKDENGNVIDTIAGVDTVNGQAGTALLKAFDINNWQQTLGANIIIPNAGTLNLFTVLSDTDKSTYSATDNGSLSISGGTIEMDYLGVKETILIRVIASFNQGGVDTFRFNLRRGVDDSLISTHTFTMNSNDVLEDVATVNIKTFLTGPTDSFITGNGGFYIDFANNSGANATMKDDLKVFIERDYQYPIESI